MRRFALLLVLIGCKGSGGGSADAAPPSEIALPSQRPAPLNPKPNFTVDQDVMFVRDDGSFEVEAYVLEVGGPLVFLDPGPGNNAAAQRLATRGWQPADAGPGTQRAEHGYRLHIGSGRFSTTEWVPADRVFPAPWLAHVKVGDVFYERRFGNFTPSKCVVTEVPSMPRSNVYAKCDGEERARNIPRHDVITLFRAPKPGELSPGDVVYFDRMYWALVVGNDGDRVVIRESGSSAKDKAVLASTLQVLH